MSTGTRGHDHVGRVIALCRTCRNEASQVVAYPNGDDLPFCATCANLAMRTSASRGEDYREYPLEEYYQPAPANVCTFAPSDSLEFEIYDPDNNQTSWVLADNEEHPGSSVNVTKWR